MSDERGEMVAWLEDEKNLSANGRRTAMLDRIIAALAARAPAEPVAMFVENNEFHGPPPTPRATWQDYFDDAMVQKRIAGLSITARAALAPAPPTPLEGPSLCMRCGEEYARDEDHAVDDCLKYLASQVKTLASLIREAKP